MQSTHVIDVNLGPFIYYVGKVTGWLGLENGSSVLTTQRCKGFGGASRSDLADQLTLFKPGGQIITASPPDSKSYLQSTPLDCTVMSVTQKNVPSAVVYYNCAWYVFLRDRRYLVVFSWNL